MTEDDLDPLGAEPVDQQAPDSTDSSAEAPADEPAEALRTGNVQVDAVLDSLEGLDELPVDDHVAVFERAHDELRRALDADPHA